MFFVLLGMLGAGRLVRLYQEHSDYIWNIKYFENLEDVCEQYDGDLNSLFDGSPYKTCSEAITQLDHLDFNPDDLRKVDLGLHVRLEEADKEYEEAVFGISILGRKLVPGDPVDLIRFGVLVNESFHSGEWDGVDLDSGGLEMMYHDQFMMLGFDNDDAWDLVKQGEKPWRK